MRAIVALALTAFTTITLAQTNDSWAQQYWDVIVVGAGPAGIIVADRMSEAGKKTLLIEQGGPSYYITGGRERPAWLDGTNCSRVDVPGLYKSIFADPGNLTCLPFINSYTGCTVGGSSAINAGLFFQPPASDFDTYFPSGWKSSDVNPAIRKVYNRVPASDVYSANDQFYVQSGYEVAHKWLVDSAGYSDVNFNAEADDKYRVFGRPIFDYNEGQRGGPSTNYLQTALSRSNFHLQINTKVTRVSRNGSTANGVVANENGVPYQVKLNPGGRVILSGGALQSPQLLMYSGIGNPSVRQQLSNAGILNGVVDWINNTAVGDGLFDNPNTFIELSAPSVMSYVYNYSDPISSDAQLYVNQRSGPYAFASETSAFWTYINHTDGSRVGLQGTIDSAGFADYTSNMTITLNVYGTSGLLSKGAVVLDSTKNTPGPNSDVYYSNPRDAQDIAQFIYDIFSKLNGTGLTPLNIAANSTVDQIRDYITSYTPYTRGQVQHWSSSCRIGSCVDTSTVVKGTTNIHVVDASILEPLTVNPQFGTMIAAERASELILALGSSNDTVSAGSANFTSSAGQGSTNTTSTTLSASNTASSTATARISQSSQAAASSSHRVPHMVTGLVLLGMIFGV